MRPAPSCFHFLPKPSILILSFLFVTTLSFGAAPDRIVGAVIPQQSVKLAASVPPQAEAQYDQGPVDASLKLSYMTLLTVPSASQQKAITRLLAQQQDPNSPLFHQWLTPEQYADRFGLSPNDVKKITAWLESQGFAVQSVARGRNWITFSGTAAQVENAFQVRLHNFDINGEKHFANTTAPSIPAAFAGVVVGFRGLNNFRPKSYALHSNPDYTLPVTGGDLFFLAPGDIATMYDIGPLYTANNDGTGQMLAVIGQTDVYLADLNDFRSGFNLPMISGCTTSTTNIITSCDTTNFKYVLVNTDPGTPSTGDLAEADIDLEWSNAVARGAKIIYVNAPSKTGNGVGASLYYAIDNAVAPVITLSYGLCELSEALGNSGNSLAADEAELKKANTEGITLLNSSGDSGAAGCDFQTNIAIGGVAVSYPASSPEVTGVGGTLIPYTEYTSTYWSATNDTNGGSALSYIPEEAWNDAQEISEYCAANPSNTSCSGITSWAAAQTKFGLIAGGGGASNCVVETGGVCASSNGGFPQPAWQSGLVIPGQTTATRFVPDVSGLASVYWPGYILCTPVNEIQGGTNTASICANGIKSALTTYNVAFGGTSISTPIFAGMVTLLNQYLGSSGLGNINPKLYSLAATPANGAFNQVKIGNNGAFCSPGTPSGQPLALQCPGSGFFGFDASSFDPTTGYNLATGLGSVDVDKLAVAWAASRTTTTNALVASPATIVFGQSVTLTATVSPSAAKGAVTFSSGSTSLGNATLSSGVAQISTTNLPVGTDTVTASYAGDGYNKPSTGTTIVTVVAPTFTFVITPGTSTSHTVLAGQKTLAYNFTATPTSGAGTFTSTVTFACAFAPTDATLTNSSCAFTPATIAAGTTGATPVSMVITSAGPNTGTGTQLRRRADNRLPWLPLTLPLAGIVVVGFAGRKMSRVATVAGMCLMLALAGFLIACGSTSNPISISSVTGSSASIYPQNAGWTNATATFTAVLANDSGNKGVTWAVSTANGGTIASTDVTHATYTPPTIAAGLPSNVTITATSVADASKTGTATIALTPTTLPNPYTVTVTAAEATTQHSQSVTLVVQ